MTFISQPKIEEARDAIRGGRRLEDIAGELGVSADYLARLIDLQPVTDDDASFCIFDAVERLEAIL